MSRPVRGFIGALLGAVFFVPTALAQDFEISAFAGAKGDATVFHGGRWGDGFGLLGVGLDGAYRRLGVEANVHFLSATSDLVTRGSLGAKPALTGVLRLGFQGEKLEILAGAVTQFTGSAAMLWVPTLHARYDFSGFGLSAGVFDHLGYAPAHVSVDRGMWSVGFVAPLGLRGGVKIPLSSKLSLGIDGFGFALGNYQSAMLTVSTIFRGGESAATSGSAKEVR